MTSAQDLANQKAITSRWKEIKNSRETMGQTPLPVNEGSIEDSKYAILRMSPHPMPPPLLPKEKSFRWHGTRRNCRIHGHAGPPRENHSETNKNETSNNSSFWYSIIRKSGSLYSVVYTRIAQNWDNSFKCDKSSREWTSLRCLTRAKHRSLEIAYERVMEGRSHNPIGKINRSRKDKTFVKKVSLSNYSPENIFHIFTDFLLPQFFICLQ